MCTVPWHCDALQQSVQEEVSHQVQVGTSSQVAGAFKHAPKTMALFTGPWSAQLVSDWGCKHACTVYKAAPPLVKMYIGRGWVKYMKAWQGKMYSFEKMICEVSGMATAALRCETHVLQRISW